MLKCYLEYRDKTDGWDRDYSVLIIVFQGLPLYTDLDDPTGILLEYPLRPMNEPPVELTSIFLMDLLDIINKHELSHDGYPAVTDLKKHVESLLQ